MDSDYKCNRHTKQQQKQQHCTSLYYFKLLNFSMDYTQPIHQDDPADSLTHIIDVVTVALSVVANIVVKSCKLHILLSLVCITPLLTAYDIAYTISSIGRRGRRRDAVSSLLSTIQVIPVSIASVVTILLELVLDWSFILCFPLIFTGVILDIIWHRHYPE